MTYNRDPLGVGAVDPFSTASKSYTLEVKGKEFEEKYIELTSDILKTLNLSVGDTVVYVPRGDGSYEIRKGPPKQLFIVRRSYIVDEYLLIAADEQEHALDTAACYNGGMNENVVAVEKVEHVGLATVGTVTRTQDYRSFKGYMKRCVVGYKEEDVPAK